MKIKIYALLAALAVLCATAAIAETRTAVVADVDALNRSITLRSASPEAPEPIRVTTDARTRLIGFQSLSDLRSGDRVRLDGASAGNGAWLASTLELNPVETNALVDDQALKGDKSSLSRTSAVTAAESQGVPAEEPAQSRSQAV